MSIATELTNYKNYLTNAYNKCAEREAAIPDNRNMQNITDCIDSINRYTELTYIESTGTQWIDTGVYPNFNTAMEFKFEATRIPSDVSGFGLVRCNIDGAFRCFGPLNHSSQYMWLYNTTRNSGLYSWTVDTVLHTIEYQVKSGSNTIAKLDGNNKGNLTSYTGDLIYTVPLFARNWNGTITGGPYKLYYCKIFNKETRELIRDFIPVLDSNNVACMYDKVNNVFYYNQGTGTFVAGDVVLDYIESTGTQYINTSVASEVNTKVNMKVMFPQISSSNAWFFGINYTNNFLVSLGVYASYPRFAYKSPNYVFSFSPTISTNTKYQVEAYFGASSQYVKVNGTTNLSKTESLVNGSNQGSFRLFNRLDQGDTNLNMRLYSCKIYKDDVLKADFIPVLKADTKEPCLYDKTRNLYKANLGTGTFLFG